ncbi:MAG: HIT family protein [Chloroflexota bacterium]
MAYIGRSEPEPGCLFCNTASGNDDDSSLVVHRGAHCFVMLNLYPYNSGHLMVVPYQHVGSFDAVEQETGSELFATAQLAIRAINRVMDPDGYNMGLNQGDISGAGIPDHIHLHLVPRWSGDTNFMPVLSDAKVIPEMLSATAAKLRPVFAELHEVQ